jgi:hypothetical protein
VDDSGKLSRFFTIPEIRRLLNPGKSAKDMCIKKSAGLLLTLGARGLASATVWFRGG